MPWWDHVGRGEKQRTAVGLGTVILSRQRCRAKLHMTMTQSSCRASVCNLSLNVSARESPTECEREKTSGQGQDTVRTTGK